MSATPNQCHYFTLWIKRSSCIKTRSVITDNCKKIRPEYQLTTVQMSELKAVLKMTTSAPSHKLKDVDATDTQLQQWRRDPAWPTQFCCSVWSCRDEISDACFVYLLLQDAPHAIVLQLAWRWVVVISSTAFNSDIRTVVGWYSWMIFLQLSVMTLCVSIHGEHLIQKIK